MLCYVCLRLYAMLFLPVVCRRSDRHSEGLLPALDPDCPSSHSWRPTKRQRDHWHWLRCWNVFLRIYTTYMIHVLITDNYLQTAYSLCREIFSVKSFQTRQVCFSVCFCALTTACVYVFCSVCSMCITTFLAPATFVCMCVCVLTSTGWGCGSAGCIPARRPGAGVSCRGGEQSEQGAHHCPHLLHRLPTSLRPSCAHTPPRCAAQTKGPTGREKSRKAQGIKKDEESGKRNLRSFISLGTSIGPIPSFWHGLQSGPHVNSHQPFS